MSTKKHIYRERDLYMHDTGNTNTHIHMCMYTQVFIHKVLRLPRSTEAPDITVADTIPWELGPFLEKRG